MAVIPSSGTIPKDMSASLVGLESRGSGESLVGGEGASVVGLESTKVRILRREDVDKESSSSSVVK